MLSWERPNKGASSSKQRGVDARPEWDKARLFCERDFPT
jgi:hypothetical protein